MYKYITNFNLFNNRQKIYNFNGSEVINFNDINI